MNQQKPASNDIHRLSQTKYIGHVILLAMVFCIFGCDKQIVSEDRNEYLLSYTQAKELDCNIAWQTTVALTFTGKVTGLYPYDDMIVTTEDGRNVVSAVTARDGSGMWETPVGDKLERLLGVVRDNERIIANSQSDLYVLDTANGTIQSHQKYGKNNVAMTVPFILGDMAIYGTPDGRIVYHRLSTGMMQAAYRFSDAIPHTPVWLGDAIAVITQTGQINVMDPGVNSQIWVNHVLDPIQTRIAVDSNAMYVAGTDQSVWAFRLVDGKRIWRFQTQYPLNDDPKVIDGIVYQAIPHKGLTAIDASNGHQKWVSDQVTGGTVITRFDQDLIIWDKLENTRGSVFYRVDSVTGDLLGKAMSNRIDYAAADKIESGTIYGLTRNGVLIKLIP